MVEPDGVLAPLDPKVSLAQEQGRGSGAGDLTLHQLRIFWAVAHSETLTKAAKQLGLAQPSLSQQLAKLEASVGSRLFHRRSNEMVLTEAGQYLLPKTEQVLRTIQELEEGLQQFRLGHRQTIRLAGISSVLRVLLPGAITETQRRFPDMDFDIQESAPDDILELLYSRRAHIGLLAANSIAEAGVGFLQIPLIEDPHVLVVPERLRLEGVVDPVRELDPEDLALLGRSIQFSFGTQHTNRVEDWYAQMMPANRTVAQCRSFEMAVELVRAGNGVCLAPALSTVMGTDQPAGIRLYRVNMPARRLVALVPSQHRHREPYRSLLEALQAVCASFQMPQLLETPLFLDRAAVSVSG